MANRSEEESWLEPGSNEGKPYMKTGIERDPCFVAELITHGRDDEESAFPLVDRALQDNAQLSLSWEELRSFYKRARTTKKGSAPSRPALQIVSHRQENPPGLGRRLEIERFTEPGAGRLTG